jgi:hypothetical protein
LEGLPRVPRPCLFRRGQIILSLEAPVDFDFTAGGLLPGETFQLDDDPDSATPDTRTFSDLTPGNGYAVAETVPSRWDQTSATCDNGSTPSNITVDAGETVTCTFTNVARPGLPASASPIGVSLVPAFHPCTGEAATGEHSPPIGGPSCDPNPTSSTARVGSENVAATQFSVVAGDVEIAVSDSDVQTPAGEDYDPTGMPDLNEVATFRITDNGNCASAGCS